MFTLSPLTCSLVSALLFASSLLLLLLLLLPPLFLALLRYATRLCFCSFFFALVIPSFSFFPPQPLPAHNGGDGASGLSSRTLMRTLSVLYISFPTLPFPKSHNKSFVITPLLFQLKKKNNLFKRKTKES